jgi:hypothetical protein
VISDSDCCAELTSAGSKISTDLEKRRIDTRLLCVENVAYSSTTNLLN